MLVPLHHWGKRYFFSRSWSQPLLDADSLALQVGFYAQALVNSLPDYEVMVIVRIIHLEQV